ncbi:MAG: ABC transporter permease [Vicinamibacterales bacterium]
MREIRYAVRSLSRQPLFTTVAALTLAVGIGANTAIFSLLYRVLLAPLPYGEPDRLVFIWNSYPRTGLAQASVAVPDYLDRRAEAPALADATLFAQRSVTLAEGGQPEQVRALRVTPSFFSTLGRTPQLGRSFSEADAEPGADFFAILTYGLWNTRFAADPSVIGRDVRIDGVPHRVVGVLPADFDLPARDIALLVPFSFTARDRSDEARGNEYSAMIGRLAPGATVEQLNAQMDAIVQRVAARLPERRPFIETSGFTGYAVPIRDELVGDVRTPLMLLQIGVALVLLIACANVANLLLMRATGRHRELAIRTAIGAGRVHLVRQLLTEGLVLAGLGAAGGLAIGFVGVRALIALAGPRLPGTPEAALNLPVLGFTVLVAAATGLVFGLVPAWSSRDMDVEAALREEGGRTSASRGTGLARSALVVSEVALAVMLLVGAGLLLKSLARLQQVDPGFASDNVLTAQISLPAAGYPDPQARLAFWRRLSDALGSLPGATSAGLTSNVPFNGMVGSGSYRIVGYTPPPGEASPHARLEVVGGDYFRAMGIPLVRGRVFTDADIADAPMVAVVDEYLVRRYFPDSDPIGRQIQRGGPDSPAVTIVGVVGTINTIDLGQPVEKERLYFPVAQLTPAAMGLVVKTAIAPQSLVADACRTPRHRSRATGRRRPHHGSVDCAVAADAAGAHRAARPLRRRRPGALGHRHLRRARLRRGAADAGVRHPAGAGRRSRLHPHAGADAGRPDGGRGHRRGPCGRLGGDPLSRESALRRRRARPVRVRHRRRRAAGRGRGGLLPAGAGEHARGSADRPPRRVSGV